jgi:protoporphyrinogen oxidase
MSSTRDAAGRELMGWLRGGYQRLIDALVEQIRALGGEVHAGAEVEAIDVDGLGPSIRLRGVAQRFDQVVCTLMPVQAARLLPSAVTHAVPDHCRYLGVVCTLLRLDRSLSPYYTLNITDRRIPLTTVVETTHVVDPGHAGGHLVYAAKYVDPGHPDLSRPVAEVESDYLGHIRRIFPLLEDQSIQAVVCQRARAVEPVHTLGGARRIPDMFPAPGLALASTAHVYPEIVNGQAVIGVADRLVEGLLERLPEARLVAA